MSGHSKWSSIKHKKGAADAKRGKLFTKLSRSILVAAKEGGPDPATNMALANAIEKARSYSMPKDNIDRAVAKGSGEGTDGAMFETVVYEGYGPEGVAVLVEALTDNRNRTGSEVRHTFTKHGGNLGEPGSVNYLFDKKGLIVVDGSRYSEDDLMAAIEAGAEDVESDEDGHQIWTAVDDLHEVARALEAALGEAESVKLAWRPQTSVEVGEEEAGQLLKLVDALEDDDDVQTVWGNYDVPEDELEKLA
jgi:YebC/PmpR family DNA-binding regulatory protein